MATHGPTSWQVAIALDATSCLARIRRLNDEVAMAAAHTAAAPVGLSDGASRPGLGVILGKRSAYHHTV